jgi:hypothetical protein
MEVYVIALFLHSYRTFMKIQGKPKIYYLRKKQRTEHRCVSLSEAAERWKEEIKSCMTVNEDYSIFLVLFN